MARNSKIILRDNVRRLLGLKDIEFETQKAKVRPSHTITVI